MLVAAKRLGVSPVQVLLKWARSKGVSIVTFVFSSRSLHLPTTLQCRTSTSKAHLKEYLAVEDLPPLKLTEIQAIEEAGAKGPPSGAE